MSPSEERETHRPPGGHRSHRSVRAHGRERWRSTADSGAGRGSMQPDSTDVRYGRLPGCDLASSDPGTAIMALLALEKGHGSKRPFRVTHGLTARTLSGPVLKRITRASVEVELWQMGTQPRAGCLQPGLGAWQIEKDRIGTC